MTETKGRGTQRDSDQPAAELASEAPPDRERDSAPDLATDLKLKRAEFVQTFFKKGAEFTDEIVRENERVRREMALLENENTKLRTQLAKNKAMSELLDKIEQLEREKERLLSTVHEAQAVKSRFTDRFSEIEAELENFANLYVASYQLHSTLRLSVVLRHLKELLLQLVGARALAFYVADDAKRVLTPVAIEGVDRNELPPIRVHDLELIHGANGGARALIERVFLTGVAHIVEGSVAKMGLSAPAACVPMRVEDEVVGVIVVFSLLEQKPEFLPVDRELFKLLGAHAATALIGAQLYAKAGGALPSLDALKDVTT